MLKKVLSTTSTQASSSDEIQYEQDYQIPVLSKATSKLKTELCKTYSTLGYCYYGMRCKFAHGLEQLVKPEGKKNSRRIKCNRFWKKGCCPYGTRCQFDHSEVKWRNTVFLKGLQALISNEYPAAMSRNGSKLLEIVCQ